MRRLPRKATGLAGVKWYMQDDYLYAEADGRVMRVRVPGAAVLDQAVNLISHRIRSLRYAAAH